LWVPARTSTTESWWTYLPSWKEVDARAMAENNKARSRAREMLLKAIVRNPSTALRSAPAEVQKNEAFLLEAIEQNATVTEYVSRNLRHDKNFALRAVAANARALWHLPQFLQQSAEIIVAAVAKHGADVHVSADEKSDDAPTISYYLRVLRSSRTAVQEIRDEVETEAEAERVAAARREDRLAAEVAALTAKTKALECSLAKEKKKTSAAKTSSSSSKSLWDSVSHSEDLCANALHLETLRVNALQTKVADLARVAVAAGADASTVNAIKSKPLQATTVTVEKKAAVAAY